MEDVLETKSAEACNGRCTGVYLNICCIRSQPARLPALRTVFLAHTLLAAHQDPGLQAQGSQGRQHWQEEQQQEACGGGQDPQGARWPGEPQKSC